MREKTDPFVPEASSRTSGEGPRHGETRPAPPHQESWIDAYQEAQRSLVEVQGAFQRAMTESHLAFLNAMERSLAGLRALAGETGAEAPPRAQPAAGKGPAAEPPSAWEPSAWAPSAWEPAPESPEAAFRAAVPRPEPFRAPGPAEKPWAVWDESGEGKAGAHAPAPPDARTQAPPAEETADEAAAANRAESEKPAKKAFGRFVLQAEPAVPVGLAMSGLATAAPVMVTDEGTGVARALVEQLQARGVAAEVVSEVPPGASGAILLGGLRPVGSLEDTKEVDREAFRAARALARRFTTGRGVFVTVQDTGGDFGLSGSAGERAGLGGLAGLAKSARLEWPGVTVKAIDLERGGRPAWKLAKLLAEELFDGGPELEVGLHADGRRITLRSTPAPLDLGTRRGVDSVVSRSVLRQSSVLVAAGGARGGAVAALTALAGNARPRMVLLGRTLLADEPDGLAAIDDADELFRALADGRWQKGLDRRELDRGELDREVRRILAAREIRVTLAALHQAGSEVRYHAVDVTDREALTACLDEVRREWGPLTGLVHAAATPSESLLADKTDAEFDLVFNTKVDGLLNLLHATSRDPLDLVLLFSSLAARTGRRGRADTAMADEVLNKVAASEHARRGDACLVKALDWSCEGGSGDADAALEESPRIPPDVGARMLVEELQAGLPDQVEVILGLAPEPGSDARASSHDLLTMDAFVSAATHPFLEGYNSGGVPMLPISLVLEWFIRLTRAHRPDLEMAACRDLEVLRSVRLTRFYEGGDAFTLVSHQHRRGSGRELRLELYAREGSLRYSAVADMARPGRTVSASDDTARLIRGTHVEVLRPWPFSTIYGHALFQGPECQVIREIEGISKDGMVAVVAGAREMGWAAESWRTDLAALDGGLQLAVLWFQQKLGGAALPTSVASYHSHFSGLVEGPIRVYLRGRQEGFQRVLCDVAFVNEHGTLVGELRGVEARAHVKPAIVPESDVPIEIEAETEETAADVAEDVEKEEPAAGNGSGAPRAFSPAWHEKASRIAATIDALLGVSHANAQLVLGAKGLGELVRFVGGEGKLYLDLPEKYLGPDRMPRAEKFFAALGVERESTELYEAGRLAERFESFGLELGNDTGRATQIVLDLFTEVYQLRDDFQLVIQES